MIGTQLDQATLDNLLIPSPVGSSYLYDMTSVLRLLKSFISKEACFVPLTRIRKIISLIDLNITEVALHPCLKPSKCLALVRSLLSLLGTRMIQHTMPRLCILRSVEGCLKSKR